MDADKGGQGGASNEGPAGSARRVKSIARSLEPTEGEVLLVPLRFRAGSKPRLNLALRCRGSNHENDASGL